MILEISEIISFPMTALTPNTFITPTIYVNKKTNNHTYIHNNHRNQITIDTTHALSPKGQVSQIFLRNAHVLPKLLMRNTADMTGGKPIAV
jgi:hypothetical protein